MSFRIHAQYIDYTSAVCKATLESSEYKAAEESIERHFWCVSSIVSLFPQTNENLWSGHIHPWIECEMDFQISCALCMLGLYKQGMAALRSALELGLLSVYWNLNDDGHKTVQNWLRSLENTPRYEDIWRKLSTHRNFLAYAAKFELQAELLKFNELHNYVHTKGVKYSNMLGQVGNVPRYQASGFTSWYDWFTAAVHLLAVCHLVKYPLGTVEYDWHRKFGWDVPSFGGLNGAEVRNVKWVLREVEFECITEIAKDDEHVQELLGWIMAKPDFTQEQMDESWKDWNKLMIKGSGLQHWLSEMDKIYANEMDKTEYDALVRDLSAWAKAEGVDEPPHSRPKRQEPN